jgi:hypothetical protein
MENNGEIEVSRMQLPRPGAPQMKGPMRRNYSSNSCMEGLRLPASLQGH